MELRRTPARRAGLAALAALLVLGASACSGGTGLVGTPPAATVNDTDISQADVVSATEATQRFYEYSIRKGQDTDGSLAGLVLQLRGNGEYSVGTQGAAQVLSDMIVDEVMTQELAEHDALPTKDDIKAEREKITSTEEGAAQIKEIDKAYVDLYLHRKVLNDAFTAWAAGEADKKVKPLTDEEREAKMRDLYEQTSAASPLCLNAIQATTEAEASAARARIDGGEDFLAVAKSLVPEGTSFPDEGLLACLSFEAASSTFGQDFSKLALGDIVGPVTYTDPSSGTTVYLVLRVDDLDGQTYEQMLPKLEAAVPKVPEPTDPTTFDAAPALDALLRKAHIEVNPVFGTWSDARRSVVPPQVPGKAATTLPVAAGS